MSAQVDCAMPDGGPAIDDRVGGCGSNHPNFNAGGIYDTKYSKQEYWIPNSNTPEIMIPVAIHIFQDANGEGNYTDVPATHAALAESMGWINGTFQSGGSSSDPQPWQTYTTDSKVNFVLDDRVFFYPGTGLETACGVAGLSGKITYLQTNHPERLQYLGIYMVLPGNCGQFARMPYPNWTSSCWDAESMSGYNGVQMNPNLNDGFANATVIAHELAHCLDLNHLYNASCPESCLLTSRDYLTDIFGPAPPPSCLFNSCSGGPDPWTPGNTVTNNIMNGCQLAAPFWTSDLQAGRFQRSLAVKSVKDYALDAYSPSPLTVTQDETWNFEMRLYRDVVVETGATLTLRCILEMPSLGRIIVKPGARLIIDGGWVTTARYSAGFWQGIQAWGNSTQHQYGSPVPTHQALVILKNGGLVEHAFIGVQTQNPDAPNTTGGVVQVQGTTTQLGGRFLNCQKAVDFDAYQNFLPNNPGNLISNRSYFNFCDFVIDDNYRGSATDFTAHVDLWKVDGLRFKGCTWQNLRTTTPANSSWELGQGILSLDAKFTVSGACTTIQPCCLPCPEANLIRSTFTGLDHGIDASVAETDRAFLVTDCGFSDNVVGVYSRNVNSFQVLRSNFNGGGRLVTLDGALDGAFDEHRGVFTSGCHGFRIEENRFELTPGATDDFAGAWVNNSAQYNDVVYRNTAINCKHGFVGEGLCSDPTNAYFIGLQFLCNTNNNPTPGNDIFDKQVAGQDNADDHSIRQNQGSMAKPAGNIFTLANPPYDDASDIRNNTEDSPLNYWHLYPSVPQTPVDVTAGMVPLYNTFNNNPCLSNFNTGLVHPFTTGGILAVKSAFETAKAAYVNTAYTYNALLDGGNTDQLINDVEQSWPEDAWELRNTLMERSPHLSEEVLREVVVRNILPQAMLLEVLLANPDATKQNSFVKWVEFDAPFPLPIYMIELIVGSWEERTFRTQLESSMAQQHGDMSVAANLLISECKSDTTGEDTDSTLVYWKSVPSFGARYSEVLVRIQRSEYTQATNLLNDLDENYPRMSGYQLAERDNGLAFVTVLSNVHGAGHDVLHLTAAERTVFRTIASHGCDRPAQWAQNILCYSYGECTAPCSGGEATPRSMIAAHLIPVAPTPPLSVYPNPATVFVTLAHDLGSHAKDAVLVLRSMEGAELKRIPVFTAKGQYLLDTRSYAPGTYTVDLLNGGNRIATECFVLKP